MYLSKPLFDGHDATRILFLDKDVCVSIRANALRKNINLSVSSNYE